MKAKQAQALVAISALGLVLGLAGSAQAQKAGSRSEQKKAASVASGSQCVQSSTVKPLLVCPSGVPKGSGKMSGKSPQSRLRTANLERKNKKTGPTGPSIELDAAARRNKAQIRARAWGLLQKEVQVLERLVQNTPKNEPRRPEILLRQAETQFEMQQVLNAKARSYDESIYKARQQKNAAQVQKLSAEQKQAEQELTKTRKETIRTYAMLVQDHPKFPRMDEVLFSLAFGLEELKQFDQARQVYHRLIKGYPQSPFIPHAYLSFAEYYFSKGEMKPALQFYDKVIEYPEDKNPVYGYALYKAAWAYYNVDDFKKSLQKFVEVIEHVKRRPDARDGKNLIRQSRRELVLPYSMVGTPQKALQFFRRYADDNKQAMEMLESLAEVYYDTGKWANTIAVYHMLMSENPGSDKLCYWQSRVTNAVISSKPKAEQVSEVERLVDVYEKTQKKGGGKEARLLCKQETASVLVWLATTWHREAVGSDSQPGTNDKSTMRLAARLYELVVQKFPDLEKIQFPTLDKRDWPTQYKLAYYHAELLWKLGDWTRCGPAFDKVVELNPRGEFTSDAAYAAVLCYNNLYQQQYQQKERQLRGGPMADAEDTGGKKGKKGKGETKPAEAQNFESREFTPVEKGMLNAFQRYVCFVSKSEELPTIKYRRARIYYEANRFDEAAVLFKDIAWNHKDSELAVYAANLYLDSLNVLGTRLAKPRPQCIGEIKEAMEPLWGSYCNTQQQYEANRDLCKVVEQLRCDVLRKEAEVYEKTNQYKKAASTYVKLFRRFRECGRLDEVLFNAAIDFEAARLLGRAIQVRKVLIQRFPDSPLAKKAVYLVGANFHALAYYEQAADYYEQFAAKFPGEDGAKCSDKEKQTKTCPVAQEALMNATFFRIGLGQSDKAIEDARLYEKNYRKRFPMETAQVVFSIGSIYERQKNWSKVVDHYRDFLKTYRKLALPNQIIKANVEIAKAYWVRDDRKHAREYFDTAIKAWKGGAEQAIQRSGLEGGKKALALYEAKDAASEAMFHLAEYSYNAFKAIKFPVYRQGKSLAKVNIWAQKEFKPWVDRKRKALEVAEGEYNKIAGLEIPQWQIASAARVGEMYRSFVDEFRDAPIPSEIESDPELFDIYVGALDEQSEPFQKQAVQKFEFCIITSTKVRWFNQWSRQCETELNRLNPREYPVAAELRGQANSVHRTLGRPGVADLGKESEELFGKEGGAK